MGSRINSAIALYVFAVFGVFLLVVPWSALWDQALLGVTSESIQAVCRSGWARGMVSGLGLLDLWVAIEKGTDLFFVPEK